MKYEHTPVMLEEVLEYLGPGQGEFFVDCTLGGGGYTIAVAKKIGAKGKVLAIDLDKLAIKNTQEVIKKNKNKNIILAHDNFKNLSKIVKKYFQKETRFNGIVFDFSFITMIR